ncbi:MAG: ATP-grasp domain-containing protein [Longimicrobiales bacterium]
MSPTTGDGGPAVLVTSASRKVPLLEALAAAARDAEPPVRIIAGDLDELAVSRFVAGDFWVMPRVDDATMPSILDGCLRRGVRLVVPTRDGELGVWAEWRTRFLDEGIRVSVSDSGSVRRCMDKLAFADFGRERGFSFIPTGTSPDDVPGTRFAVKERFGAGSLSLGLDLDRAAALRHAEGLEHPIFQPMVEGQEISVDAWLEDGGRLRGLVLRHRDRVVAGESQVTTTFRDGGVEEEVARMLEALELRGHVVLQGFYDGGGRLDVIECNARFGGASTASIAAGLDSLRWTLAEAGLVPRRDLEFRRSDEEVRMVRVPVDRFVHDPRL